MDTRFAQSKLGRDDLDRAVQIIKPAYRSSCCAGSAPSLLNVDVIIPCYWNAAQKASCLRHVVQGHGASQCLNRFIFVLPSDDLATLELIDSLHFSVEYEVVRTPPGCRGGSRNAGALVSTSQYILFLDDDSIISDWVEIDRIVAELNQTGAGAALFPPREYLEFPLVYSPDLPQRLSAWRENPLIQHREVVRPYECREMPVTTAYCFPGCFGMFDRSVYNSLGGFSDKYVGWGLEDADLALRAISSVRTLNLYHASFPVLHIDHTVSPYKWIELDHNMSRFTQDHGQQGLDYLSDWVMSRGSAFSEESIDTTTRLLDTCNGPRGILGSLVTLGLESCIEALNQWCHSQLGPAFESMADPIAVLLHGSRARGDNSIQSDWDLLLITRLPMDTEFCVLDTPETGRVEVELSCMYKFERIAKQPWLAPQFGPLELEKLSFAPLIANDPHGWSNWHSNIIHYARKDAAIVWALYLIDCMHKDNGAWSRHSAAYKRSLNAIHGSLLPTLGEGSHSQYLAVLGEKTREDLDRTNANWRDALSDNRSVFPNQVPEIWRAMRWLAG